VTNATTKSRISVRQRNEDGQVVPAVLVALVAFLGLGVMFFAVSRAGGVSARSQTAADAAALSTVNRIPELLRYELTYNPNPVMPSPDCGAASGYATANHATLENCAVTGAAEATVQARATDSGGSDPQSAASLARAEADIEWTIALPQRVSPGYGSNAKVVSAAFALGVSILPNSGLLAPEPVCGGLAGGVIDTSLLYSLMYAEWYLQQPVNFTAGWNSSPCAPPPSGPIPDLVRPTHAIRVSNWQALSSLGPAMPMCQPYPSDPSYFALSSEPVCGGQRGQTGGAFPGIDSLFDANVRLIAIS
jgi:hypothetical protein